MEIAPSSSFTVYECRPLQPSGGCASTGKPVMSCTPNKIFLEAEEVSAGIGSAARPSTVPGIAFKICCSFFRS